MHAFGSADQHLAMAEADSSSSPLRIALIADRLTDHSRQCEAVIDAIGEVRPIDVTRLTLRASPLSSRRLRRLLLWLSNTEVLAALVRGEWRKPFDLIVSAGGSTITSSVLLKRRNGASNIHSGQPRGIRHGDIDCILTRKPELATVPNYVFSPSPVLRFKPASQCHPLTALSGSRIGVILGGEARAAGFDFDGDYCRRLFERLRGVDTAIPGIAWVVVTSRRTPSAAYPAVEAFCAGVARCDFVDFRVVGQGSISRAFGCEGVLVTEDSRTMITEFVRNGFSAAVLRVPRVGEPLRHAFFDDLVADRKLEFIEPEMIDPGLLERALKAAVVASDDAYADLRVHIGKLLPGMLSAGYRPGRDGGPRSYGAR